MKMQKRIVLSGALLTLLAGQTALAAEFAVPNKEDRGNLTLGSGETHRNLYTAGANVVVQSAVSGDLVAAGGMLQIMGAVDEDLLAAGGNVFLTGRIGGDARVAGGNITIQQPVSGDLVAAGGNIFIADGASIGGDMAACAGNLTLNAPVSGSLRLRGDIITINSKISGDVDVRATDSLVFGPKAEIAGKITFSGPREAIVKDGAEVSAIDYTPLKARAGKNLFGLLAVASLIKLLAVALAAWLLLHFMPRRVKFVAENVQGNFWKNLGLGFVGAIIIPIAVIIALITVVGFYAAIIVALWYAVAMMLACLLAAITVGDWVLKKLGQEKPLDWQAVIIGTLVYGLLWLVPFVGALVAAAISLATFGAMLHLMKKEIQDHG